MALGTLTMSRSGRMPACFDTASGSASAGAPTASAILLIPSGMTAIAPMRTSGFTCLYISAQGIDSTLGVTGQRGMIGVPPNAGPLGTIKIASGKGMYLRATGASIERTIGSTITLTGPVL